MWHCPIFYLKQSSHAKIITCKRMRNQNKRRKKHTKQSNRKYEICLMDISQMYDYVFNEEEMKKRGKKQENEDEKRKSTFIFSITK